MAIRAAEDAELAQRDCPPWQTNTNPQAQASWQVEGDRGGAHQQRLARYWQQVARRKDDQPGPLERVVQRGGDYFGIGVWGCIASVAYGPCF
jgi:hypothetical protein